jgi:alkylation response protein AidB-like acyl-CoA dehydrogenase
MNNDTVVQVAAPQLERLGLAAGDDSDEVREVRMQAGRFAREVMRPSGIEIDRLSAAAAVAANSPLHEYLANAKRSGLLDLSALAGMTPAQQQAIMPALNEELGYGDVGLALLSFVSSFTAMTAHASGQPELIDRFGDSVGCWIGAQPDRGSDVLDFAGMAQHPNGQVSKGNLLVRRDDSDFVINGQSAAWISVAPIATAGLLHAPCDYGDGFLAADGSLNHIQLLVPFDEPGLSKGPSLEKLGQRTLPQGEIFFDSVRLPGRYMTADRGHASAAVHLTVLLANLHMGMLFTGVARAAFELAFRYAHERRQGGVAIIDHQLVRARIFTMWQKLEACRALSDRAIAYHYGKHGPHGLAGLTNKTFATQTAFDIAREAVLIFGANGLTREYPVEKLLRDTQTALIQDGENNLLGLLGAGWLTRWYREIGRL